MMSRLFSVAMCGVLLLMLVGGVAYAEEPAGVAGEDATEPGQWKTAFVKRGFVGAFEDRWLSGSGSVIRSRTPLGYGGTRVRVQVQGAHRTAVSLASMALVQGADEVGTVTGPRYPILFDGQATLSLATAMPRWSDAVAVPVTAGTWYVQDSYGSKTMPYAYDVDRCFSGAAGSEGEAKGGKEITCRVGVLSRVDVWTTDPRMSVLCYGDSITHGYGSTPNAGARYPDRLAALLGRPTLNMGVNGDVIVHAGGMPGLVAGLSGVDTVIILMGINDLIGGHIASPEAYALKLTPLVTTLQRKGLRVYVGTLPPARGYAAYDAKPPLEGLRRGINIWLRTWKVPDGLIDFDEALRDPKRVDFLRADCQSDWLHPNDAGYERMAVAAAAVLKADAAKAEAGAGAEAGEAGAGAEAEADAGGKAVEQ